MFEIYVKMKRKKCWKLAIEVPNAWGGMPHLWMYLEKKYLPSYVPVGADGKPLELDWVKEKQAKGEYVSRWICASSKKGIEDLQKDFRLTYEEMMVFRSTFDFAKVLGEDIPVYLECLKVVADECGGIYPQQYEKLSAFIKTHSINDIETIAFNQTSVNCACDFFGNRYNEPADNFWDCICPKDFYDNLRKDAILKTHFNN